MSLALVAASWLAAAPPPVLVFGGVDAGRHQVLNTWPLFDPEVAIGTGQSSAMVAVRAAGQLRSLPALRLEAGLAFLPLESSVGQGNTVLLYSADLLYVIQPWTFRVLEVPWTPVAGGGLGLYQNLRGDLGHDMDPTLHAGIGLRGVFDGYAIRINARDYLSDYIKGEGPGNNLELSVGLEILLAGEDPELALAKAAPPAPAVHVAEVTHTAPVLPILKQPETMPIVTDAAPPAKTAEQKQKRAQAVASIQGTALLFSVASSQITAEHDVLLQKVSQLMRAQPWIRIVCVGFADSMGAETSNVQVSHKRAQAVMARLSQLGVDPSRMLAAAAGEDNPFSRNDTARGRTENRRVEIHVLNEP